MTDYEMIKYQAEAVRLGVNVKREEKIEDFLNKAITALRAVIIPSKEKRLTRHGSKIPGVIYEDTLDKYYVDMINDTLSEIRKKRTAYIFNLKQVAEILRFEPLAKFRYLKDSDSFAVTL